MTNNINSISFLLGAGFSKPAGFVTAADINLKLTQLNETNFSISTDNRAWWLNNDEIDPNASWSFKKERLFIRYIKDFYVQICESFNYEEFVDFCYTFYENTSIFLEFNKYLNEKNFEIENDFKYDQLIHTLHNTIRYLVKSLIYLNEEAYNLKNYENFFAVFNNLSSLHPINIFTLNHDNLFEHFFNTNKLKGFLSDGFDLKNSRYYTPTTAGNKTKLSYFSNSYESDIKLFKLHGSLNDFIFKNSNNEVVIVKDSINSWLPVIYEGENSSDYPNPRSMQPFFLMGSNYKIKHYTNPIYYNPLFERFREKLVESSYLIVIGYSFKDSKINDLIRGNS